MRAAGATAARLPGRRDPSITVDKYNVKATVTRVPDFFVAFRKQAAANRRAPLGVAGDGPPPGADLEAVTLNSGAARSSGGL